jgi:hypothetical protein
MLSAGNRTIRDPADGLNASRAGLGSVEIHLKLMTAAEMWIIAAKLRMRCV